MLEGLIPVPGCQGAFSSVGEGDNVGLEGQLQQSQL